MGTTVPAFAKLHQSVVISPSLSSLSERLQLPKIVPLAVDRAIAEIIFPTVERSVTIGRMTTIELVNKVRPSPLILAGARPQGHGVIQWAARSAACPSAPSALLPARQAAHPPVCGKSKHAWI